MGTVQLDDISAEVNDFCWQFAKSSWPFVTGEGVASVSVRQASVFLEYSLTYTEGRVMIMIEAQSIDMKEFEVHVAEATWLAVQHDPVSAQQSASKVVRIQIIGACCDQ